VRRQW